MDWRYPLCTLNTPSEQKGLDQSKERGSDESVELGVYFTILLRMKPILGGPRTDWGLRHGGRRNSIRLGGMPRNK